jgi:hypothetical protein
MAKAKMKRKMEAAPEEAVKYLETIEQILVERHIDGPTPDSLKRLEEANQKYYQVTGRYPLHSRNHSLEGGSRNAPR